MRRAAPRPHGMRRSAPGRRGVGASTLLIAFLLGCEVASASGAAASPSGFVLRSVAPIPGTTVVLRTSVPAAAADDAGIHGEVTPHEHEEGHPDGASEEPGAADPDGWGEQHSFGGSDPDDRHGPVQND
jgi:hypothetical protein